MLFGLLLTAGLPAGVLIGLAVRAYRRSGSLVTSWAAERELELTDESRPMVTRYLRTSRSLRLIGALGGFVLAPLAAAAFGMTDGLGMFFWLAAVAGYLIGILYAEVTLQRPPTGRASIRPRRIEEYLSPWTRRAQRRTEVISGVVVASSIAVPMRDDMVSRGVPIGLLITLAAVVFGVNGAQRWLVRRPQPVFSDALTEADDAIRRQSVHSIAGAGIGLMWLLSSAAMMALAYSDVQILRWTMWIASFTALAVGLAACTRYESGALQIRRPVEA